MAVYAYAYPQLKCDGDRTTRTIEADGIASARKKAIDITPDGKTLLCIKPVREYSEEAKNE
jgi:hypothetical protein